MQDRKRFLTTTLTVFFCAAISVAAFADDYYWDVADGDWSVGSNWDPSGPPTSADSVYIDNGGTVRLSDDAASNSFHVDDGLFIQDDGDLTIYSHQSFDGVSYANMSIGRNRYYTFNPDMSRIYHDGTYGEYNLLDGALTGDDDVSLDMDIYYGRFNQYGGTVDVSRIFMRSTEDVAEYNLYAGDLSAESLILSSDYLGNSVGGVFNQYGGSCELGSVKMTERVTYSLDAGSLVIDSIDQMFGSFNLGSGGFSLELGSGILNLSDSTVGDVSAASFQGGAQSLLILPSGVDPTSFGSFATDGLVHVSGGTLTIPSGHTIEGPLEINDHVDVKGTLLFENAWFNNGVTVSDGGALIPSSTYSNVIYIGGGVSNIEDGTIDGYLHLRSTTYAEINQSGGTVTGGILVGNQSGIPGVADVYNLTGGMIDVEGISIGGNGEGVFNQSGGEVLFSELQLGINGSGEYLISGGELRGENLRIRSYESSRFLQTGGAVEIAGLSIGNNMYSQQAAYVYSGGSLNVTSSISIYWQGTFALQADWTCTANVIGLSGGTLDIAEGYALTIGSQKRIDGWGYSTIKGAVDFAGEDGSISVGQYGTLNISEANFIDASSATFTSEADTLIVVPTGYDIAAIFGTASIAGTVMEMSDKFVVAAGEDLTMSFTLPMAVEVYGTLRSESSHLASAAGLTIKSGGVVDVGTNAIGLGTSYYGHNSSITIENGGTLVAGEINVFGEADVETAIYQYGGIVNIANYMSIEGYGSSSASYYQYAGTVDIGGSLFVGGRYIMSTDSFNTSYHMSGGTLTMGGDISIAKNGTGKFYFEGGEIYANDMRLGDAFLSVFGNTMNSRGEFHQTGGTINLSDSLQIGQRYYYGEVDVVHSYAGYYRYYADYNNTAEYRLVEGRLLVGGSLNISQASEYFYYDPKTSAVLTILGGRIEVGADINIWQSGVLNDVGSTGGTIELWGNFQNKSMMNEDFDLRHTTLILNNNTTWLSSEGPWNLLDMNSEDYGASVAGLRDNFAIGNLVFSGTESGSVHYQLQSDIYCYGLSIEYGVGVDLNGYNIYYMPTGYGYDGVTPDTLQLDGQWYGSGGIIAITDAPSVPEPGTIAMIAAGALGLAGAIRRRIK